MLRRLADLVTRRPKTIIAIWIVALVIALPFAGLINGALEYDDSKMGSSSLESVQGAEYESRNFPGSEKQGTTILVLQGQDVPGNDAKTEILNMESQLRTQLEAKGLEIQVDSVYSYLVNYSKAYLLQLRSAYVTINASLTSQEDPGIITAKAIELTAQKSNVSAWLVRSVAMPDNFDEENAAIMADDLVGNSSILAFPIPIIKGSLGTMINLPTADTMVITLTYLNGDSRIGVENIPLVRQIVHSAIPDSESLKMYVTGSDAYYYDNSAATDHDMGFIEPLTVLLIIVLIGVTFRSFLASSIPPFVIGLALMISFALVYVLGTHVLSVHYTVALLMLTSMMGAGCDYCIFILSRYRDERHDGVEKLEAIRKSMENAGESILTSGVTVMIGFGVLALASLDMMRSWSVLAIGIGIALLVALTFLPALLALLGDRTFWPSRVDKPRPSKKKGPGHFARAGKFSIEHARAIILVTLIISVPTTYMVVEMTTSEDLIATLPDNEFKGGLQAMSGAYGEGMASPTYIIINMSEGMVSEGKLNIANMNIIENITATISSMNNVREIYSPSRPDGGLAPIDYANLSVYSSDVASMYSAKIGSMIGTDGHAVSISVIFAERSSAPSSIDTMNEIRSAMASYKSDRAISAIYVTGNTAMIDDITKSTQSDFVFIVALALALIYFVLLVVLGSVINPLKLIATILISISWTLAIMVVVFQYVLDKPIVWFAPILLVVICLGLGMDYDIFLTTRIREEVSKGLDDQEAIVHSLERTGAIITTCGIIMASAFATMMLSSNLILQEFGFGLSVVILIDAMVVRIYMVPAIMSLLGKWNWWAPRRLQRVRRDRNATAPAEEQASEEVSTEMKGIEGR